MEFPVLGLRPINQLGQGRGVNRRDLFLFPIVPEMGHRDGL